MARTKKTDQELENIRIQNAIIRGEDPFQKERIETENIKDVAHTIKEERTKEKEDFVVHTRKLKENNNRIPVQFVQTAEPVFVGGKSFGPKIYDTKSPTSPGLATLEYDLLNRWVTLEYKGEISPIPYFSNFIPYDVSDLNYQLRHKSPPKQIIVTNVTHAQHLHISKTAQVADPTGVTGKTVK